MDMSELLAAAYKQDAEAMKAATELLLDGPSIEVEFLFHVYNPYWTVPVHVDEGE